MEELKLVSNDCRSRMDEILNASWKVFKWQFVNKAFVNGITSEASFQFHFASIIKSIGDMYVSPKEMFYVDIETKWNNKKIDITCGFCESGEKQPLYNCAIELKFKRKRDSKGTFSDGRIFRMYRDIDYLERETGVKGNDKDSCYSEGRFYFITDNSSYMSKDEAFKQGGTTYTQPLSYKNEHIHLNNAYPIKWDESESIGKSSSDKWYFLEIDVADVTK
ncbi:MAG TPA: hypothetical protein IAC98_02595 [Candidatus Cryptobacteroides pullicola]|nr:hypothetical protein [Candidatus Cryptobacteroides pullicola]